MIGPELLGPAGMVRAKGTTHGEWRRSSMPVVDEAGVEIRMDSTVLVEDGGCHFGVVPNME